MKKFLVLMSFLLVPMASAEGPNAWTTADGTPVALLETTTIGVDIRNVGERIVWGGQGDAVCFGPSGQELQGSETGVGWVWETTAPGVHEIFMSTSQESWDVRVTDANFQDLGAGRVFSKSWHVKPQLREPSDPETDAVDMTVYIKTPTAVVEARLEGIDAENLYLFATSETVTGYQSKRFDELGLPGMTPQSPYEAMLLINPLYFNMMLDINLPIYVSKIPGSDVADPVVREATFDPCPDPDDSTEQAIVITSSTDGVHYTSCIGPEGQYDWGKGPVEDGTNHIG